MTTLRSASSKMHGGHQLRYLNGNPEKNESRMRAAGAYAALILAGRRTGQSFSWRTVEQEAAFKWAVSWEIKRHATRNGMYYAIAAVCILCHSFKKQ